MSKLIGMPFTPFHFGPGLLIKSFAQKFSLTIFIFSQIIMDLEPLYFILTSNPPVHRFLHTFAGSHAVVLISVIAGKPICEFSLRIFSKIMRFKQEVKISWAAAFVSALVGAYSHVFMDCLMHRDMNPLYPFSAINPILHLVSLSSLHWFCAASFALGSIVYLVRRSYKLLLNP